MSAIYDQAMECYKNHDWTGAEKLFLQVETEENVGTYLKKCRLFQKFSLGNTVPYGTKDGQDILWKVLEERGNMRLLLSEELLAFRPYRDVYQDTFWENASLRKWLNSDFITEHFSKEEARTIIGIRNETPENADFFTNGGPRTVDKVFILSKPEIEQYLPEVLDRDLGKWWWIRTPGSSLLTTSIVYSDGTFYYGGVNVNSAGGGVRPAMWVLLRGL